MPAQPGSDHPVVCYERHGAVALVTINRPEYRNAQNSAMTYALDEAFYTACDDDAINAIVLAGAGEHFSAGHDIGSPGRDVDVDYERKAGLWWGHVGKSGGESRFAREQEVYLEMRRLGLALAKKAVNQSEDLMGLQQGLDSVFGLHHFAHAHNAEVGDDALRGMDARSMKKSSGAES